MECTFLEKKLNRIIIVVAAVLVLVAIVAIGVVNNLDLESSSRGSNTLVIIFTVISAQLRCSQVNSLSLSN